MQIGQYFKISFSKRQALMLILLLTALALGGYFSWPYISFLTDKEAVSELIKAAGWWSPAVLILLQMAQTIIAPIPGTVISVVGGIIFGMWWSALYTMIGTTLGFFIVFTISKRYGRSAMKYFVSEESVKKYDKLSTSKSGYVFIALGFLFPFIPDPILGYIAGATPISTRVLMVICFVMRLPGILMASFVGKQVGEGNFMVVGISLVALAVILILSAIFYEKITKVTDKLYAIATRENTRAYKERVKQRRQAERQKKRLRRRRQALVKKVKKTMNRPVRTRRRKTKYRR